MLINRYNAQALTMLFFISLALYLSTPMGFTNTEALESREEDVPIKFIDMSQTEPSPDSKRMSTFKPEESTHL